MKSDILGPRLEWKRSNLNKIKPDWSTVLEPSMAMNWYWAKHSDDYEWNNPVMYIFTIYVKTTAEQRANEALKSDGYGDLVRGKRRHLPTAWDDKPNSAWKTRKSWKHHSKRRHQWKVA